MLWGAPPKMLSSVVTQQHLRRLAWPCLVLELLVAGGAETRADPPQAKGETYPAEEYRLKGVIDRVNTTAGVWLGLTVACAECHDHKFDPISQVEYYRLLSLFNSIEHSGQVFLCARAGHRYSLSTIRPVSPPLTAAINSICCGG